MRTIFAGTPEFAVPALRTLAASSHDVLAVFTQPDRPAGRGRRLRASPIKQLAQALDLPVYQPSTLRSPKLQRLMVDLDADIMVVAAYGLLLPQMVLDAPRLGCVNIHASLLPRWRGAAPIQRAILAGDPATGVTIMQMAAGLDNGDLLLSSSTPITDDDNAASLHNRLAAMGAELMLEALAGLAVGTLTAVAQDESRATYAPKLDKAEAEIDWAESAEVLSRQVRAFNPWPVAQTRYRGASLRIWRVRPSAARSNAPPGQVIDTSAQGIDVATGNGVLRLLDVQLSGGRRIAASDFANARSLDGVQFPC
jgi:methionyl-tRNA formyltransferase